MDADGEIPGSGLSMLEAHSQWPSCFVPGMLLPLMLIFNDSCQKRRFCAIYFASCHSVNLQQEAFSVYLADVIIP